jgi:Leucine-rich repeat (LRR) protein
VFEEFKRLTFVNMSGNKLSGSIPDAQDSVWHLKELTDLHLSGNLLSGTSTQREPNPALLRPHALVA